jgi:hypothetical protein
VETACFQNASTDAKVTRKAKYSNHVTERSFRDISHQTTQVETKAIATPKTRQLLTNPGKRMLTIRRNLIARRFHPIREPTAE